MVKKVSKAGIVALGSGRSICAHPPCHASYLATDKDAAQPEIGQDHGLGKQIIRSSVWRILGHIDGRIGIKHGIALVSLGNEGTGASGMESSA